MTIAPSYHHSPPSSRRKRSLEEVSPSDDAINNTQQQHSNHHHHHHHRNDQPLPKTSRSDFYLNRMDHRLQWALKCAREGNLRMMDFYLTQAKKDAIQCRNYGATFVQWEAWIRGQLQHLQQQQQI